VSQKSVVARKKLGSRDQRPLHRKGAKSAKNFGRGEASLAPTIFKKYGCPAGQGTSVPWVASELAGADSNLKTQILNSKSKISSGSLGCEMGMLAMR